MEGLGVPYDTIDILRAWWSGIFNVGACEIMSVHVKCELGGWQ